MECQRTSLHSKHDGPAQDSSTLHPTGCLIIFDRPERIISSNFKPASTDDHALAPSDVPRAENDRSVGDVEAFEACGVPSPPNGTP